MLPSMTDMAPCRYCCGEVLSMYQLLCSLVFMNCDEGRFAYTMLIHRPLLLSHSVEPIQYYNPPNHLPCIRFVLIKFRNH